MYKNGDLKFNPSAPIWINFLISDVKELNLLILDLQAIRKIMVEEKK